MPLAQIRAGMTAYCPLPVNYFLMFFLLPKESGSRAPVTRHWERNLVNHDILGVNNVASQHDASAFRFVTVILDIAVDGRNYLGWKLDSAAV